MATKLFRHAALNGAFGAAGTFLAGALLLLAPIRSEARSAEPVLTACPSVGTQAAQVTKVDEHLDLALSDGRSLHLAGLDPPQATQQSPDLPRRAQEALTARVAPGITFIPLSAKPDRWGRIPAFVFVAGNGSGQAQQNAADILVENGLARFMPAPEAHACRADFLAAEKKARQAKLGLWHDPFYAIIAATNRTDFAGKSASNVIVEGRIINVSSNAYRTTLAFAPPRDHAFSVTILKRNVAIFERSGLDIKAPIGRILRVRGLLDLRFGPQIEIATSDAIEVISTEQDQGAMARQGTNGAAPPPSQNP
ncbi:MAG TPA: thermonuclease family protein [Methylovirgula sp.]|nr:thermonuclease family protein [Methylovirgula sp.]